MSKGPTIDGCRNILNIDFVITQSITNVLCIVRTEKRGNKEITD